MKPERWSKVESIFHKALEADESRRGSVIEESCAGDEELRREVESLLAHHSDSASFIEQPAFADRTNTSSVRAATGPVAPRPDLKGVAVGHYRILEEIGFGGMGVVYKAEDTRLGRLVALKFLPEHMAADSVALERFRREARSASSLNHPNICTIHDIDVYEGREFIVMEYLDGQTLATYIAGRRSVGTEFVAKLGMPIAEALGAAHSKGVIHRDIKPANIFVTQSGLVKVLDFGVAKLVAEANQSDSTPLTETNTITGTLPYMSPEQLRGENLDTRSDIYALGVVLYEIATGQRLYSSSLHARLVDEILNGPASPPSSINGKLSARADDIILKCLAKDPEDRYQTAKEIAVDLRHLGAQATSGAASAGKPGVRTRRKVRLWLLAAAAALTANLVFLLVSLIGSHGPTTPLETRQITFTGDKKDGGLVTDGARLYFESDGHPVQMSVAGGAMQPLQASVSGMKIIDVSPDASQLMMFKGDLNDETDRGSIWTIPVLGGSPRRLGNLMARGASWSPNGNSIVYADLNSIFVSDANGANPREIWNANHQVDGLPRFSTDSKRIQVTVEGKHSGDPLRIFEMNADGSNVHPLPLDWPSDADQRDGQWTPDGRHFVFVSYRDGFSSIYELVSPPWFEFWKKASAVRVTPAQMDVVAMTSTRDSANLLVIGRIAQGSMQAYDSKGQRFIPFLDGLAASSFVISPDRQWMVYADYPRHLLWRSRLDGSERLALTDIPAWMPEWSPDGKWVVFCNFKAIYRVSIDGGVPEQLTSEGGDLEVNPTWSPDGTSIDFSDVPTPGHSIGIKVLDLASKKVSVWAGTTGMYVPSWSPDGKYMVAIANPPKRLVLYSRETKTWRTLKQFGAEWGYWRWSKDSKSILMAKISAEPGEQPGVYRLNIADAKWTLVALFNGLSVSSSPFENFLSITSDGRPVMMSDTSVVQIYSLRWDPQ
ncbi:protein kinase [Telmatobacter sp. DSM 110680]|uniref:Protein kinase n=1 Tax=Telmatobacter sp. DSM 110680 TaxID=3036704 RepID=A0AAU7DNU0_9BACT